MECPKLSNMNIACIKKVKKKKKELPLQELNFGENGGTYDGLEISTTRSHSTLLKKPWPLISTTLILSVGSLINNFSIKSINGVASPTSFVDFVKIRRNVSFLFDPLNGVTSYTISYKTTPNDHQSTAEAESLFLLPRR